MALGVFKPSISFPNKIPSRTPPKPPVYYHNRSISLPCSSHPLISRIKDEINDLKTRSFNPGSQTSAWLFDGLSHPKDAHDSLDDILQLPQTQESLRCQPKWVEKLLEDFLRLVDVYGIFQTLVLGLKEEQLAVRKKDDAKIALYIKSRQTTAKELSKLLCTVRCIAGGSVPDQLNSVSVSDVELAGIMTDVVDVTVLVSVALFNGISASFATRKSSWMGLRPLKRTNKVIVEEGIQDFQGVGVASLWGLRKRGDEEPRMVLKRMQELEGFICGIESGSERVFRSLINTRVLRLNSLTRWRGTKKNKTKQCNC